MPYGGVQCEHGYNWQCPHCHAEIKRLREENKQLRDANAWGFNTIDDTIDDAINDEAAKGE